MPLTREAIELRDNFLYSNVELILCDGTWTEPTNQEILSSAVLLVGPSTQQTMVWQDGEHKLYFEFTMPNQVVQANRLVLMSDSRYIAYIILPFKQIYRPGVVITIDGRTFSS